MATPAEQRQIDRLVTLHFQVNPGTSLRELQLFKDGVESVVAGMTSTTKVQDVLRRGLMDLGKTAAEADKAINGLGKSTENAKGKSQGLSGVIDSLGKSFTSAISPINAFGAALGAGGIGISSSITGINRLNVDLLRTSGSWAKYGVGTSKFEKGMQDIAKATKLTQAETTRLMSQYEKGFGHIALKNAKDLMVNLRNAVGANVDSMGEMLNIVSQISQKFPDLEDAVTRLNAADRQRLSLQNQMMVLTGSLSLAQAKQFQDYIQGNKQRESEDEKRHKEIATQIDTLQEMKRVFEEIARTINDTLMPYIKEMVEWIRGAKDYLSPYIGTIAKIAGGFLVVKTILGSINGLLKGFGMGTTNLIGMFRGGLRIGGSSISSGINSARNIGGASVGNFLQGGIAANRSMLPLGAVNSAGQNIGMASRWGMLTGGNAGGTGMAMAAMKVAAPLLAGAAGAAIFTKAFDFVSHKAFGVDRVHQNQAMRVGKGIGAIGTGAAAGALVGSIIPGIRTAGYGGPLC
jgi:hypothetical protein